MPQPITIANLRNTKEGVRCDRSSILGNPFEMRAEAERDPVCDAYDEYFYTMATNLNANASIIAYNLCKKYGLTLSKKWKRPYSSGVFLAAIEDLWHISKLKQLTLLCWCEPKRCHCQTIKQHLENS
jgi:hypothetical protein